MEIRQNNIWVSIDETCDVEGRFIANVIVGILKPDCPGHMFLLYSEKLDKVNHIQISASCLKKLWALYGLVI